MRIRSNKHYRVKMGYDRLIANPQWSSVSAPELRALLADDMARCRRKFGTAVMHTEQGFDRKNRFYLEVTARRDKRSALWGRWVVEVV